MARAPRFAAMAAASEPATAPPTMASTWVGRVQGLGMGMGLRAVVTRLYRGGARGSLSDDVSRSRGGRDDELRAVRVEDVLVEAAVDHHEGQARLAHEVGN